MVVVQNPPFNIKYVFRVESGRYMLVEKPFSIMQNLKIWRYRA